MTNLLRLLLRRLSLFLVRLYYPELRVEGADRIPARGPVIFVMNHPNGLLDPLVLQAAISQPVRFLAKHTLFGSAPGRLAMGAFGCFPVYRSQDTGPGGGAARNEETFARCRQALRDGQRLALFPEGTSHSDPALKPLKTGAARIALSANVDLEIVPVGLSYESKAIFRSRVLLVVGRALKVADHTDPADERGAVDRLTAAIRAALDEVVLQAETRELLDGIARVAMWTATEDKPDPARLLERSRDLAAAYNSLRDRDPARVEAVVQQARNYERILRRLGIKDPWALEFQSVGMGRALLALAGLIVLGPIALLGVLLGWGPYRLTGVVAARVTREEDVLGTVKLLGGALFLFLGWLVEIAVAGRLGGWVWGLATVIVAPAASYVALRFGEAWSATAEAMRHLWLRGVHFNQVRRLAERRFALAEQISRALDAARADQP